VILVDRVLRRRAETGNPIGVAMSGAGYIGRAVVCGESPSSSLSSVAEDTADQPTAPSASTL